VWIISEAARFSRDACESSLNRSAPLFRFGWLRANRLIEVSVCPVFAVERDARYAASNVELTQQGKALIRTCCLRLSNADPRA
jgi:hypothetical protein